MGIDFREREKCIPLCATISKEGILKHIAKINALCDELKKESYRLIGEIGLEETPPIEGQGADATTADQNNQ